MIMATKMRKGHDFHKDKGWEIVKSWPIRENTHVSSPLVLPNHLHWELLLVVEAVIVLGVEWQDCLSSPTRTLHHSGWIHKGGKTFTHSPIGGPHNFGYSSPLHELLSTHRLQFRVLLVAIYLHALIIWPLIAFTHRKFSWVLPTRFSPAISVLSIAVHFCAEGFLPVFVFTHWILPGLPTQYFLGRICE